MGKAAIQGWEKITEKNTAYVQAELQTTLSVIATKRGNNIEVAQSFPLFMFVCITCPLAHLLKIPCVQDI
jgi:hypothetical protein